MSYYITIPSYVYMDETLSNNAKLLFGYMASLANKSGICFSTNAQITADLKISADIIRKALKELDDSQLVHIEILRGNYRRVFMLDIIRAIKERQDFKKLKQEQIFSNRYKKPIKGPVPDWLDEYLQTF